MQIRDEMVSQADSIVFAETKPTHRSAMTNGSIVLPGVDGRSTWARRLRDLIALHVSDMGGDDAISTAELSIIRRAATLTVELERLEAKFATAGQAEAGELALYTTTSNTLKRLLEAVGLRRRPRDVTPDLHHYISGQPNERP
jgi:hypothetical protein